MAAFERAADLGVVFIETDLHLTRDARFVAIHDDTLERTTNGRGKVSDFTLAELRRLDNGLWYDRQYMGQRIPTLEDILEFGRKRDVVFYLEVKYEAAWGMHHALVGALQKEQDAARTIVISFDASAIESVRKLDASIMTGLLIDEGSAGGCGAKGARCRRAPALSASETRDARIRRAGASRRFAARHMDRG